jgi:hypothetical protein
VPAAAAVKVGVAPEGHGPKVMSSLFPTQQSNSFFAINGDGDSVKEHLTLSIVAYLACHKTPPLDALSLLTLEVPAILDEVIHSGKNIMWGDGRAWRAEVVGKCIWDCQEVWHWHCGWGAIIGPWRPQGALVCLDCVVCLDLCEICDCIAPVPLP